jgi:uncharacterized protein YjbJ (UPF0337 family)
MWVSVQRRRQFLPDESGLDELLPDAKVRAVYLKSLALLSPLRQGTPIRDRSVPLPLTVLAKTEGSLQRWSMLLSFRKATGLQRQQPMKGTNLALRGRRRSMDTSTKDNIKGTFHEVKGKIKEEAGKLLNDRDLKAEGKAEKNAGKVQQQVGHAKEKVADLKEELKELKK